MIKRTRRQFLEDSMLAAAAAVAANTVPSAFAALPGRASAGETLALALVGAGGRAKEHVNMFAGRPDVEIVYVVDPDPKNANARADEIAKRQKRRPRIIADMRKAYDDKSVDLVSIATPNHWHALAAIWAIQHGKDVYLEKPVSHNVSEGRRIVEAARKYKKICQTGTQSRSMPGMRDAIKYIHDGNIGKVTLARGLCYKRRKSIGPAGNYPVPDGVDYNLWLGPAPQASLTRPKLHYDWHWQWPYGNGDLGNQGIHQMDLARWGLGLDGLSRGVLSYGGRLGYEDAGNTANTQIVMHNYGDRSLVFEVRGLESTEYRGAGVGVIFEGTDGYVAMASYYSGAAFDLKGKKVHDFSGQHEKAHYDNFIAAVRSRDASGLAADIAEGHLSSALCHLGNISYRLGERIPASEARRRLEQSSSSAGNGFPHENMAETFERTMEHLEANGLKPDKVSLQFGRPLAVDAKNETLVGNGDASAMLTRDYRAPFVVPPAGQV